MSKFLGSHLFHAKWSRFYDIDNNGRKWVNGSSKLTYYRDHPEISNPKGSETSDVKVINVWEVVIGRNSAYKKSVVQSVDHDLKVDLISNKSKYFCKYSL